MAKQKKFEKWLKKHLMSVRLVLLIMLMLFVSMQSIVWGFQQRHADQPLIVGVSFSTKYAYELGNDWQRNYLALLDELNIKHLRLMSYWDQIEPSDDSFDFSELDWQMDQAAAHNATVSLAVGQRQPRWPECHIPDWVRGSETDDYKAEVIEYLQVVVARYKDHPALESYQLENEARNRLFGLCQEDYDNTFIDEEFAAMKAVDPDHDIILNASNQSGIPLQDPVGDRVGFSIYKRAHFEAFGRTWPWSFWYVPNTWHGLRAAMVEAVHDDVATLIHELQAEPWGPEATVNLSFEEQNKTMDADKLRDIFEFAKQSGMREIYLWGGEWWYWRLTDFNDKELWQTAKAIMSESS